jgi:hypothetical protein
MNTSCLSVSSRLRLVHPRVRSRVPPPKPVASPLVILFASLNATPYRPPFRARRCRRPARALPRPAPMPRPSVFTKHPCAEPVDRGTEGPCGLADVRGGARRGAENRRRRRSARPPGPARSLRRPAPLPRPAPCIPAPVPLTAAPRDRAGWLARAAERASAAAPLRRPCVPPRVPFAFSLASPDDGLLCRNSAAYGTHRRQGVQNARKQRLRWIEWILCRLNRIYFLRWASIS